MRSIFGTNRPRVPQNWEGEGKWPRKGSGVCRFCNMRVHTHTHALANGRRSSRRSTLDSKSVARTSTYVGGGDRERERERESRIGRQERAELRSAELPFLRTCLAASSSSPTDYDRLLLSLCMHLVRPQTYTLSFLFFFSILGSITYSFIVHT